jgi:anaerobic magnesium-protoporphyrin IX monomethyl ester cyclase
MKTKCVLIQPPSPYLVIEKWGLPLGLLYLKTFLEKQNHHVELINLAGVRDYLEAIPIDGDIYGISVFTPQHELAIEIGSYLKNTTGALLVAGGHHVTALPEEFLKGSDFDIVVRGEGEFTFSDICNGKDMKEISGISYKQGDKIIHNPDRGFPKNIDIIPFPSFDGINLDEYTGVYINQPHSRYRVDIMTSRGCPYNCAFCSSSHFWKRQVRFHSAEYVVEYLAFLYKKGINDFTFADDNFALKYPRLEKICRKLESLGSEWTCEMRSDSITPELANMIKRGGCHMVSLGIESGSDKVLQLINKQVTVEDHKRAVSILKKAGLEIKGFLMVGLPGEDQEAINDTVHFIQEQPVDYYTISTFVPYPGTAIWNHPEFYNYDLDRDIRYGGYCSLSNDLHIRSAAKNYKEIDKHREILIEALGEKCTNLRSFKIGGYSTRGKLN